MDYVERKSLVCPVLRVTFREVKLHLIPRPIVYKHGKLQSRLTINIIVCLRFFFFVYFLPRGHR